MKKDKRIIKIIDELVASSFNKNGELREDKVQSYTKALGNLPGVFSLFILSEYVSRLKRELNNKTLRIESVIPLDGDETNVIYDSFKQDDTIVSIAQEINPSILGGIRVTLGDVVYDDTLSGKIVQLREFVSKS